eukprot:TRINITY_DN530_c1_g2_i5.p1 TRINITY_DN530_c1_g2~~TRINITY_DN530_c1_g2_i5.p1  ORF type:complete len:854 (-),score=10.18 TRINITY_DN530_c1_g2_i5:22-2583(-)
MIQNQSVRSSNKHRVNGRNLIKFVPRSYKSLTAFILSSFKVDVSELVYLVHKKHSHYVKHNGITYASKRLKDSYTFASRVALEYSSIEPLEFTKSSRNGVPKDLRPFMSLLMSSSMAERRIALMVLNLHTVDLGPVKIDLASINRSFPSSFKYYSFKSDFKDFLLRNFRKVFKRPYYFRDLSESFTTSKSGPNGPYALHVSYKDAFALNNDESLCENVKNLLSINYGELNRKILRKFRNSKYARRIIDNLKYSPQWIFSYEEISSKINCLSEIARKEAESEDSAENVIIHSRITFLQHASCKTRTVAIVDYFSQLALRPWHKLSFKLLRYFTDLGVDSTFDHAIGFKKVLYWTSVGRKTFSFDLSLATDFYPVDIQEVIVGVIVDPEFAILWRSVMTDRDFYVRELGFFTRYNCGQPMGAFSSWPTFALSHHLLIQYLACKCGYNLPFKDYQVIGDDVTLTDPSDSGLPKMYRSVLTDVLKVKISEGKSVTSTNSVFRGELAKRIALNGVELSPITAGNTLRAFDSPLHLPAVLAYASSRGIIPLPFNSPIRKVKVKAGWRTSVEELPANVVANDQVLANFVRPYALGYLSDKRSKDKKGGFAFYMATSRSLLTIPGGWPAQFPELGNIISSKTYFPHTYLITKLLRIQYDRVIKDALLYEEQANDPFPDREFLIHGIKGAPLGSVESSAPFLANYPLAEALDRYYRNIFLNDVIRTLSPDSNGYYKWLTLPNRTTYFENPLEPSFISLDSTIDLARFRASSRVIKALKRLRQGKFDEVDKYYFDLVYPNPIVDVLLIPKCESRFFVYFGTYELPESILQPSSPCGDKGQSRLILQYCITRFNRWGGQTLRVS